MYKIIRAWRHGITQVSDICISYHPCDSLWDPLICIDLLCFVWALNRDFLLYGGQERLKFLESTVGDNAAAWLDCPTSNYDLWTSLRCQDDDGAKSQAQALAKSNFLCSVWGSSGPLLCYKLYFDNFWYTNVHIHNDVIYIPFPNSCPLCSCPLCIHQAWNEHGALVERLDSVEKALGSACWSSTWICLWQFILFVCTFCLAEYQQNTWRPRI